MTLHDTLDGMIENPYFKRSEFACNCGCGGDTVDFKLLEVLTSIRAFYSSPVIVVSGFRCEQWNKRHGGAAPKFNDGYMVGGTGSQHLWGKAADFKVVGVKPKEVYDLLDSLMDGWGGLGLYPSWVHVDVRREKARWSNV